MELARRILDAEHGTDPAIYTRGDVDRFVEKRLQREQRKTRELQARLDDAEAEVDALRRARASSL
jgi:cell division septum initiation protein DivIVA